MANDVLIERRDRTTWIRLNRPERKNSYDHVMAAQLTEAVRAAVRSNVIVITGSGDSFCAGGYLAKLQEADPLELRQMMMGSLSLFDEIRRSPRPVTRRPGTVMPRLRILVRPAATPRRVSTRPVAAPRLAMARRQRPRPVIQRRTPRRRASTPSSR